MEKNYEVLKHYLQSEKQTGNMKKRHRVPQMQRDEDQIVISYPNEEVCKERVVIRQKYKNVPIPNHRHEYIELSFMMEGELSMQIEGKEIRMKSGDICLMNRNVSHSSERVTDDIWMFNILMTADFFDTIFMYLFSEDKYISLIVCIRKVKRKITFFIIFRREALKKRLWNNLFASIFWKNKKILERSPHACSYFLRKYREQLEQKMRRSSHRKASRFKKR